MSDGDLVILGAVVRVDNVPGKNDDTLQFVLKIVRILMVDIFSKVI